jgi:predicted ATPase
MNPNTKETNWVVITGGPSSGKTSVILELARRGFATTEETAREIIEERMALGMTLAEARADVAGLQREILARNLAREDALDPAALVFLDRGIGDSMAYYPLAGLEVGPVIAAASRFRYRAVFVFDPLPVQQDRVRTESQEQAAKIGAAAEEGYRALGYDPVRVPVMPIEARADFILEKLKA